MASKVAGVCFNSLEDIFNTQVKRKAQSIIKDATHPLNQEYKLLPSGLRLAVPQATKTGTSSPLCLPPSELQMLRRGGGHALFLLLCFITYCAAFYPVCCCTLLFSVLLLLT